MVSLYQGLFARAAISVIGGGIFGLVAELATATSMTYTEVAAAAAFWIASLMVPTFKGHVGRSLLWLLLLEASMALYHACIYSTVADTSVLFRLGPILVGGLLFFIGLGSRAKMPTLLHLVWIVSNLPALIFGVSQGYLNVSDAITIWCACILYPLLFHVGISAMRRAGLPRQMLGDSISLSALVMCSIPLLLIPVELALRHTSNFALLQFGGRAYAVVGALLLISPVLFDSITTWRVSAQYFAIGLFVLLLATSFSRGVLIIYALLVISIFLFAGKRRAKILGGIVLTSAVCLAAGLFVAPQIVGDAAWFWLLRMNFASNIYSGITINASDFFQTDRSEIWGIARSLIEESPFWGHGLGSTPSLLSAATANRFAYSGMHNLSLTVLVERGFAGFAGVVLLLARISYLIYTSTLRWPRRFIASIFALFLLFAHSTGSELFLNSSQSMNVTITVYLFVLIGYLEYDLGEKRSKMLVPDHARYLPSGGCP